VSSRHMISKILPDQTDTAYLITGVEGLPGTATGNLSVARFNDPQSIVMDKLNTYLYVAEFTGQDVRRIEMMKGVQGQVTVIATFQYPVSGIIIDGSDKTLYVTVPKMNSIYRILLKDNSVSLFAGKENLISKFMGKRIGLRAIFFKPLLIDFKILCFPFD
jgi:hypothetical protein